MQVVDTVMLGKFDPEQEALSAAILGNQWISGTLFFAVGVVLGIDPIVSQAHGAGDGRRAGLALQRGVVVALVLSLIVGALWIFTAPFLIAAGQDPERSLAAQSYALVQLPSVPLFLCFTALRQYLQGRGIMWPALYVTIWGNVANAAFNWVLIYGTLGFPRLGLVGAGIATCLTRGSLLLALLWVARGKRLFEGAWTPWSRRAVAPARLREVLRYGIPTGLQTSLEIWAFGVAVLMAGRLDTLGHDGALAANGIVLNIASLTFMVPLGVSSAAVTRVGNLIGAQRYQQAQRASWVAFALGAAVMTLAAVTLFLWRDVLPTWYGAQGQVLVIAASIMPVAAAFQIFDGVQVVGCGVLRGMGKTLPAAAFNLLGYWALGLPLAAWMAFERVPGSDLFGSWMKQAEMSGGLAGLGYGLAGVWWGLALGLAVVALCLLAFVRWRGPATMGDAAGRAVAPRYGSEG